MSDHTLCYHTHSAITHTVSLLFSQTLVTVSLQVCIYNNSLFFGVVVEWQLPLTPCCLVYFYLINKYIYLLKDVKKMFFFSFKDSSPLVDPGLVDGFRWYCIKAYAPSHDCIYWYFRFCNIEQTWKIVLITCCLSYFWQINLIQSILHPSLFAAWMRNGQGFGNRTVQKQMCEQCRVLGVYELIQLQHTTVG